MGRLFPRDLWHLEKALTVTAMMAADLLMVAGFVSISDRFGWVAGIAFAVTALSAGIWVILKFIPLSEYLGRRS